MTNNELEIIQECRQGFNLLVKLINGRTLCVEKMGKRAIEKYTIDLLALDNTSKPETNLGWEWFSSGAVSILLMVVFLEFLVLPGESFLYIISVCFVGLLISGSCFYMAWNSTSRKQIFYSRNANVPLVELAINNPTQKEFCRFVRKVEDCIESSQQGLVLTMNNQLAGEMRMLRRLSEEGVLSAKIYNTAKMALLRKH